MAGDPAVTGYEPQTVLDQFEANRGRVNTLWLELRDAVLFQYDTWAESSAETRRLRDVARLISFIPPDYVNTVVAGYRGQMAEVVQPYKRPHDALICLPRGQFMPAWAAWINEAREMIEIVEGSARTLGGSEPDRAYAPTEETLRAAADLLAEVDEHLGLDRIDGVA